jgi:hypothetical protein
VPMCFLRAKPIGVMQMLDQGEQDDKVGRGWVGWRCGLALARGSAAPQPEGRMRLAPPGGLSTHPSPSAPPLARPRSSRWRPTVSGAAARGGARRGGCCFACFARRSPRRGPPLSFLSLPSVPPHSTCPGRCPYHPLPPADPEYKGFNDISELPPHRLAEIRRFFEDYKKARPWGGGQSGNGGTMSRACGGRRRGRSLCSARARRAGWRPRRRPRARSARRDAQP